MMPCHREWKPGWGKFHSIKNQPAARSVQTSNHPPAQHRLPRSTESSLFSVENYKSSARSYFYSPYFVAVVEAVFPFLSSRLLSNSILLLPPPPCRSHLLSRWKWWWCCAKPPSKKLFPTSTWTAFYLRVSIPSDNLLRAFYVVSRCYHFRRPSATHSLFLTGVWWWWKIHS